MTGFALSNEPLPLDLLKPEADTGAVVGFTGRVRNQNEGRQVIALEYEAFDELALTEGEQIVSEAIGLYGLTGAACVHRVGKLELGEPAIRVEASSAHRQAAFEACRWIVDEVKSRVPIWKKEYYEDGQTEWLNPSGAS